MRSNLTFCCWPKRSVVNFKHLKAVTFVNAWNNLVHVIVLHEIKWPTIVVSPKRVWTKSTWNRTPAVTTRRDRPDAYSDWRLSAIYCMAILTRCSCQSMCWTAYQDRIGGWWKLLFVLECSLILYRIKGRDWKKSAALPVTRVPT